MKKLIGVALLLALGVAGVVSATPPQTAPEIDGGTAANALALLGGALLLVKTRRKS